MTELKRVGTARDDAVTFLLDDLAPRLLSFLADERRPDARTERARGLHTELRTTVALARGAETWPISPENLERYS